MKELEERIARDASAAAAEITASDIPPLRLTPRPSARRFVAPLAAAVSVIAVIAVVAAVSSSGTGSHRPAPGSHEHRRAAPLDKTRAADHRLATEALDWYFPASGASYTTGQAFAWTQDKITAHNIDPCLAEAGFPQPPFHGSVQLFQLSFPSGQFPDLAQLRAHPGQHYFTGQYLVLKHQTKARWNALDRAQNRCTARYDQRVTRVDNAAAALENTWTNMIARIQNSRPVKHTQPAFAHCLEAHGVPARYATQTSNAPDPLFAGYYAWSDTLSQTANSTRQAAADNRRETRVFLACAGIVIRVVEPIQLARRVRFFHQHSAAIARIARLAQQMAS
jgi:hypothetical protein